MRPSILFFDEIDGLAPVRSSRQDQIHSSIVSTLLALMDGLDSRGEVKKNHKSSLIRYLVCFVEYDSGSQRFSSLCPPP